MIGLFLEDTSATPVWSRLQRKSMAAGDSRLGQPGGLTGDAVAGDSAPARGLDRYDEKWLQRLLYEHAELIPLNDIDGVDGAVVPLCRELSIPGHGANVYLDILGVSRSGRLVLVECKLWRNPQARREVIAQITEYAALLRRWTYTDLTERLRTKERLAGKNPIYDLARQRWPDLDEAAFVDGVSRSLSLGDFHLIIAGDGIRSDLVAIAEHLSGHGAGMARLSLLEFQIWTDAAGRTVVLPQLAVKTELLTHRVILTEAGQPIQIEQKPMSLSEEAAVIEHVTGSDAADRQGANKAFWQRFIDEARFDHADQSVPRHGRDNWVRLDMPTRDAWVTAFRSVKAVGVFCHMTGERAPAAIEQLKAELDAIRSESGLDLKLEVKRADNTDAELTVSRPRQNFSSDNEQLAWLQATANRFVSVMRPRLKALFETEV